MQEACLFVWVWSCRWNKASTQLHPGHVHVRASLRPEFTDSFSAHARCDVIQVKCNESNVCFVLTWLIASSWVIRGGHVYCFDMGRHDKELWEDASDQTWHVNVPSLSHIRFHGCSTWAEASRAREFAVIDVRVIDVRCRRDVNLTRESSSVAACLLQAKVIQRPNVSAKWRKFIPVPCIIQWVGHAHNIWIVSEMNIWKKWFHIGYKSSLRYNTWKTITAKKRESALKNI